MSEIYYNENNKQAAAVLRELMKDGLIAKGVVDERSIKNVKPGELRGFTQCHFFAGIGGWSYALRLAGWPDDKPVWTGSCPCQPFSVAGNRRGYDDTRDLWPVFFNLIKECRPVALFGEQVASAVEFDWLDRLWTDMESGDYAVGASIFPAASVGAPHLRDRLYFVAYSDLLRHAQWQVERSRLESSFWSDAEWVTCPDGEKLAVKPGVCPLADGVSSWMVAVHGAGNAIVPQQAAEFIRASGFEQEAGLTSVAPG